MANRTTMTVLREISAVKAGVKDPEIRAALLAPLEAELRAMAEAVAKQMQLPLDKAPPKK